MWQATSTEPDGALRALGTFPTKAEADRELAHEVSRMARGVRRNPWLGEQPLGEWFRGWIATRGDLAPSTRALYSRLLERWIDAEVPVVGGSRARVVRLGAESLASVTPAAVREWDAAVLAEVSRRAGERWSRAASTPKRINAAIRAWALENERTVAVTGRMPVELPEAWFEATGGVVVDARESRRNLGHTEAAQAYRLLHTGMARHRHRPHGSAVPDGRRGRRRTRRHGALHPQAHRRRRPACRQGRRPCRPHPPHRLRGAAAARPRHPALWAPLSVSEPQA